MLNRLKIEEGWFIVFLVWLLVTLTAAAILEAELIDGLEILPFIGTVSVLTGLALAKSQFSSRTAHLLSLIYGLALITYLLGGDLPDGLIWRDRIFELIGRQLDWLSQALSRGSSRDGSIFVMHTSFIFWVLGYTSAWYTFREARIWRVVLPSGFVLLSIIYYYYGPKSLGLYLVIYTLVALIYIARTHLVAQEQIWRSATVNYERGIRLSFLRSSFIVGVLALAISWSMPTLTANATVSDALGEAGVSGTWRSFQDNWTRLFSSLRSYGGGTSDPYRDTLSLGGPRTVGSTPVMDIFVSEQLDNVYWQAIVFDTYQEGVWSMTEANQLLHFPEEGNLNVPFSINRREVIQQVVNYLPNAGTIYGAPQIVNTDRQTYVTQRLNEEGELLVNLVQSRFIMKQGERYQVTSHISGADAASLRQATLNYPEWVTATYLQVPDSITPATLELAEQLAVPHNNPFDKAIAVRDYLRSNISYNDQIEAPPQDREPIDYILFEGQEAYCNYYASAMAMMLRSQGIPSRVVAGYAQGDFNEDTSSYRVRASNAHTWVEVYFPGYGWIQFEPTASLPLVERDAVAGNSGDGFESGPSIEDKEALFDDQPDEALDDNERLADVLAEEEAMNNNQGVLPFDTNTIAKAAGALATMGLAIMLGVIGTQMNQRVEGDVEKSYGRLESWSHWLGVWIRPTHTPYERANMLSKAVPEGKQSIRNLTHQFVRNTFSQDRTPEDGFSPLQEWKVLRPLLFRKTIRHQIHKLRDRKNDSS